MNKHLAISLIINKQWQRDNGFPQHYIQTIRYVLVIHNSGKLQFLLLCSMKSLSVNKQRSVYGQMSRHSNHSRISARQSNMSIGRGISRISQQGSHNSYDKTKRNSTAYDMGKHLFQIL